MESSCLVNLTIESVANLLKSKSKGKTENFNEKKYLQKGCSQTLKMTFQGFFCRTAIFKYVCIYIGPRAIASEENSLQP